MRRCVIDLSDSEDDDDGAEEDEHRVESERIYSPLPTRAQGASTTPGMMPPNGAGGGDWHRATNGHSGTQSPAALHAKEEEIKKMREMIAMREQSRLKKLAAVCFFANSFYEVVGLQFFLVLGIDVETGFSASQ